MFSVLLSYAQAFERHPFMKKNMALAEGEKLGDEELGSLSIWYHDNPLGNPFKGHYLHPVEAALQRARIAAEYDHLDAFKAERSIIVEYLEPQYERICNAAANIIEFIKENKRSYELLDVQNDQESIEEFKIAAWASVLLLEQYHQAFQRDMPWVIKLKIKSHQELYNSLICNMTIIDLIAKLQNAVKSDILAKFCELFPIAVDDLIQTLLNSKPPETICSSMTSSVIDVAIVITSLSNQLSVLIGLSMNQTLALEDTQIIASQSTSQILKMIVKKWNLRMGVQQIPIMEALLALAPQMLRTIKVLMPASTMAPPANLMTRKTFCRGRECGGTFG